MKRGWVLLGAASIAACSRTSLLTPGGDRSVIHEGKGGSSGDEPAGGADVAPSDTPAPACFALCCDGSSLTGPYDERVECIRLLGMECADAGGPTSISMSGEEVWSAGEACPTMKLCRANCCDGSLVDVEESFDRELCKLAGDRASGCADHGAVAKVLFDGKTVHQDMSCAGNCQSVCCDGRVSFTDRDTQTQCEIAAGVACPEETSGPAIVAFDHALVWTAGDACPSLRDCRLLCADGTDLTSKHYQASVCIAACLDGDPCAGHGGPETIDFDGQTVWTSP